MYGIERGCAHDLKGHVEGEMILLDIVHEALEVKQGGVAFVCVVEVGFNAEFLEHENTPDTEQIFLFDTVFPVASIEFMGDLTVPLRVLVEVCVEQIEVHAAHVDAPDVAIDDASRIGHLKDERLPVFAKHRLDGELVEVLAFVVGDLLAVD